MVQAKKENMITIIQNTNTLLRVATPIENESGEVVDLWFDYIVGWQVETGKDLEYNPCSSAIPVTADGCFFLADQLFAIVNKFTEEWDIPHDKGGKGFDSLIKYFNEAR